jgi:methionyl-tRNA formyltransferase
VRTPLTLRDPAEQEAFAALDLDAAIVAAYGLILPQPILDAPRLGCLNVHASILPRWRGSGADPAGHACRRRADRSHDHADGAWP